MKNFTWVNTYNKIAHKILEYKNRTQEFAELMYKCLEEAGLMYSEEKGSNLDWDGEKRCRYSEIDPISFMNRFEMYSDNNRKKLIESFERNTGMEIDIPNDFDGIPSTNPQMSCVIRFKDGRENEDIPNIWNLFEIALNLNFTNSEDKGKFIEVYDNVISKPCAKFNISIGLFKIRPDIFLNLDSTNRSFIEKTIGIKIRNCPDGKEYLDIIEKVKKYIHANTKYSNMLEFSYEAWNSKESIETKYWIYAPGENAFLWEECYKNGIMALGWDELEDFNQYKTRSEVTEALKKQNRGDNPKNQSLAVWNFKNDISIGDVIIVKNGIYKILGYGIVESDYYYDENRVTYKHIRKVSWKKIGEWNITNENQFWKLPQKTLTDITGYNDDISRIMELMEEKQQKEDKNYYWLNANPKIWSFSELKIGEIIEYTAINENGNKRRIYRNYQNAKKGDMVIAYESTPVKSIVGICTIEEPLKDNILKVKKLENLVNPIPYVDILNEKELSNMEYMQNQQGSLFSLTIQEYSLIMDMIRESNPVSQKSAEDYTKKEFLKDVYMKNDEYDKLVKLLLRKKNVILQGAPGVGKTYMAKKLAYSIIGKKDEERIKFIQFHQSYSYEDFIEGFRPTETTYELEKGVFYNFCKQAENDPDEPYFFIIDEINRGNLSKIFGELLMLIESDKRGEKISLAYSKIGFNVPANVFIIGMMNTADRSLALIDYALRRRFAFYKVKPAFKNEEFIKYKKNLNSDKFNKLIEKIEMINMEICNDLSLGEGFEIGHSYFCNFEKISEEDIELIITYEILPLLEEYWFDDIDKYNEWKAKLNGVING